jgi:hypothetical protein
VKSITHGIEFCTTNAEGERHLIAYLQYEAVWLCPTQLCLAPSSLPCIQFGVPGTHAACKAAIQTCPYIFWEFGVLKITVTLIVNAFIVTLIIAIDFLPVGANKYIPEHECTSWDHFVGVLSFTSVSNLLIC